LETDAASIVVSQNQGPESEQRSTSTQASIAFTALCASIMRLPRISSFVILPRRA